MSVTRLASAAIVASVLGFAVLEAASIHLYPGGTWWDPARRGASFWSNYLCDFELATTMSGRPNPTGSMLGRAAMLVLVLGMVAVWMGCALLLERSWRRAAVRLFGLLSVIGIVAVSFLPSNRFGPAHAASVVVAAIPGLGATTFAVQGVCRTESRPRFATWLGISTIALASFDFLFYLAHLAFRDRGTPLLPAVEKVALLSLLAWMLAVAARLHRARPSRSSAHAD